MLSFCLCRLGLHRFVSDGADSPLGRPSPAELCYVAPVTLSNPYDSLSFLLYR